ncbi:MAG: peptidase S11 [Candidatus Zixiibacteriota bacterium]|nr:MAG: peptidase S11 [candidate division Zixibacteria bacterium]
MLNLKTLPKVLLLLAAFVFFSANTVYFLDEAPAASMSMAGDPICHFDFENVCEKHPYLNIKSGILVNYSNGNVLYAKNADSVRPIASITKLVTAMIVIDNRVDLDKTETITKEDSRRSSRSRLRTGYELTVRDLLHAALMNSDNRAARALARATSGSIEAFARDMNFKMRQLGLKHTRFVEPTGLDAQNVSTAHEVAKLLHYTYDYDLIAEITAKKTYQCRVLNSKKSKQIPMASTNLLVHSKYHVLGGKTGYIRAADYCLTTLLENANGERLTLVVLGVPGDKLRFREARRLVDWGFKQV